MRQTLILVHRWLGVAVCLLFLVWFPSGIVMMYWDFPGVTPLDRLKRSPALDAAGIRIAPREAARAIDVSGPDRVSLAMTYDGRPFYRFESHQGAADVYADTGEAI